MKGRKSLILIAIAALVVAGLAYKMVLAPKSESKEKVEGTVYVMPKEFLLNLAGGRYAKMTVALVLAPGQSTGAGEGSAGPPEGFGTLEQEPLLRRPACAAELNGPGRRDPTARIEQAVPLAAGVDRLGVDVQCDRAAVACAYAVY